MEEKSAQVKREKEALSKKQELETARAAEQAKREREKAEEERQVRGGASAGQAKKRNVIHLSTPIPKAHVCASYVRLLRSWNLF